jgi:hypothetical protein
VNAVKKWQLVAFIDYMIQCEFTEMDDHEALKEIAYDFLRNRRKYGESYFSHNEQDRDDILTVLLNRTFYPESKYNLDVFRERPSTGARMLANTFRQMAYDNKQLMTYILAHQTRVELHDPVERYKMVKYHAVFLFMAKDNPIAFLRKYAKDLHHLTANYLDIYYSEDMNELASSGYEIAEQLAPLKVEPENMPSMALWGAKLSDGVLIPLQSIEGDDIFKVVQIVVQSIKDGYSFDTICGNAIRYINSVNNQSSPKSTINIERFIMSDNRKTDVNNYGQIGAIGDSNEVSDNQFLMTFASEDLNTLREELTKLKSAMIRESDGSEKEQVAIDSVTEAIKATENNDKVTLGKSLKKAGAWALEIAEKIGIGVAIAALKNVLNV